MDVMIQKKERQRKNRIKRQHLLEFLCIVPAVITILALYYYPIVELLRISFTNWNLIKPEYEYVGLENWKWLLENITKNHVLQDFVTTVKYTAGHLAIVLVGGLLLALLFQRDGKLFGFMRTVTFVPYYIGMASIALIFLVMLNENYGIVNHILQACGLEKVGWLTKSGWALAILIIMASWKTIGYNMMIYLSAMKGVSSSYYEAAKVDGATKVDIFFRITLPMIAPTTVFLLITQFLSSMRVYAAADVLTKGGPYRATEVMVYQIYTMAFDDFRIDRASVVSLVFFLFLMIVTIFMMFITEKKTNYDA